MSKIYSCPLDTEEKQCDYGNPYVLVSTNAQISFDSANEYCKTKYGTQLASIHSNSDKDKALELISGKNHVWIGLYRSNVTSQYIWVDGTESSFYDWAKGQPTGGIEECVHIAPEKNNQWNDFPCIGYESISKWKTTDFLCANPLYDEDTACLCECDICSVEGDPHFTTFDNLAYHFMGPCTYYYVTPCHPGNYADLPIEVIADHVECFPSRPGMTCIKEVYVNLYDSAQKLAVQILLKEHLNVTYTSNGAVYKKGSVPVNSYVYFENKTNEHRAFYLTQTDGGNVDLQIYITDAVNFKIMDARIVFASSFAPDGWGAFVDIYLAECFAEDYVTCGLCGYYDFEPSNDFTWYNSVNNTFPAINSSGVSEIRGMGMDAWKRGNLFGSKWISWDLTDEPSCEVVSSPPETRCVEKAEVYCKKFWTDSCPCHDQAYYNNSWYQLCIYDTCALCPTLETLPYVNASKAGCFNIANASCYSEECTILGPTLPPTFVPTALPTLRPTKAPTPRPTLKPTPRPTNAPTMAECHDVFAYDGNYNTCIDSIVDPWTKRDVCNNTRQDCGFTNGPYNCEVSFPRSLDLYANSYCNVNKGVKIGSLLLNQNSDNCDISVVYAVNTNNIYTFEVNAVQLYVGKFPLYIDSTSSTGYSVNWNNYPLQKSRNNNNVTWYLPQYLCGEFYLVAHATVCTNPLAFV